MKPRAIYAHSRGGRSLGVLIPYMIGGSSLTGAAEPARATETLLVTGMPSVIEYKRTLVGVNDPPRCVDFAVRTLDSSSPPFRMTSTGVEGARLLDLSGRGRPDCTASASMSTATIAIGGLSDGERLVRLIVPAGAFPTGSVAANGKLILLPDGKPKMEVGFALRREDYAPFQKAFLWFWGIATPAVITSLLALLVHRFQKRSEKNADENSELETFRKDAADVLKPFFEGLYATTARLQSDSEYKNTIERELGAKGILAALPPKKRAGLKRAIENGNRVTVSEQLAKVFPEYKDTILKANRGDGNGS